MEKLGHYELIGHLSSQNSGYSVWGFGRKDGKDYFIKQFLSPKHPEGDTVSSPDRLAKKYRQCAQFERQKVALYHALNENSDGNAVRVCEFFRIESKYYIAMPKIEALPLTVEEVAALPEPAKRRLCGIIAHSLASLHRGRIIHADLKHENILFTRAPGGSITAKVIDFDSSFLETAPPPPGEDIVGDLVYFSPEACASIWGMEAQLSCKMDIFSLGVLFHRYFTGALPFFDEEQCSYAGEAVAKGLPLSVAQDLPEDLKQLLQRMLSADPQKRPDAQEVFRTLRPEQEAYLSTEQYEETLPPVHVTREPEPVYSGQVFYTPGDL